jgi:hypothetical protein
MCVLIVLNYYGIGGVVSGGAWCPTTKIMNTHHSNVMEGDKSRRNKRVRKTKTKSDNIIPH